MSRFSTSRTAVKVPPDARDLGRRSTGKSAGVGTHGLVRLPGVLPGLRLHEAQDAYGRLFAFVSTGVGGRHAAYIDYTGAGVPRSTETVGEWLARWGGVADVLRQAGPVGIALVAEGTRPGVLRLTLTYSDFEPQPSSGRRKRIPVRDMAIRIGADLPRICTLLESLGGQATPLGAQAVIYTVRAAFDPSIAELMGTGAMLQPRAAPRWRNVAPARTREDWGHVLHDGATSVVWAMPGIPEDEPLGALLAPAPAVANVRLAVFLRRVARGPASNAQGDDAPALTLTSTSTAALSAGLAEDSTDSPGNPTEDAAAEVAARWTALTRRRLRRVYGGQAAAFAAGAGLGIAVPGDLRTPQPPGVRR